MNRSEKRREAKRIKSRVGNMSTSDFNRVIEESVKKALETGHAEGVNFQMQITERALREEFGFGKKRLERLEKKMSEIIDGILEGEDELR